MKLSFLLILMLLFQSVAAAHVHTCQNERADAGQQHAGHMMNHADSDGTIDDQYMTCDCGCYCGGVCVHACSYAGVAMLAVMEPVPEPALSPRQFVSTRLEPHTVRHERPPNIV